jgi:hypothetical protein
LGLFLFLIPSVHPDELAKAAQLENNGHTAEAFALYQAWLESNPPGTTWDGVLLHSVDLAASPADARALLVRSVSKLQSPASRHAAYLDLARLQTLLGDIEAAQRAFQDASLVPGLKDYRSLLASANALLQLGEVDKAGAQATIVIETCPDAATQVQAKVLLARTLVASGKDAQARAVAEELLSNGTSSLLSPRELFQLHRISVDLGASNLEAEAAELLAQYPKSPEYLILAGKAARYPAPSIMLGFQATPYLLSPTGTPQASAPRDSSSSRTIVIQIGSYLDQANAEYRLQDLEDAGFHGEIVEASLDGTSYYRVVVPDVAVSDSQNELVRLKEKGFEGFLLFN